MSILRTTILFVALLGAALPHHAKATISSEIPCPTDATCTTAFALWGEPTHANANAFQHFPYANPEAPKGGTATFAAIGSFDSLNPYILKGIPAAGIGKIYDTLMAGSADEPYSKYPLLANYMMIAKDRSWVGFALNPAARWHDGTPITAEDVVFTFNTLMQDGHPTYRSYYREVASVEAISEREVRFTLSNPKNRELPLILAELPVLPKHYYQEHAFNQTTLKPPLGSGPYRILSVEAGKRITYQRVEEYWGKTLPVNRGRYNIDRLVYDYYRDATVAVEAFKAGEIDFRQENIAKNWAESYNIQAVTDGRILKEAVPHTVPTGMQGFVFNLRKPIFSDVRVRQALSLAFDFEWTNQNLFHSAYTRTHSFFSNSEFAAGGLPSAPELALLEPYRAELPPEIFTAPPASPPGASQEMRARLLRARTLLEEAGWVVQEGILRHQATGQAMEIEFLLNSPSFERVIGPMLRNLKRLGIQANMRTVDSAQYVARLEQWDFDIITHVFGQGFSPGNEQTGMWHSSQAMVPGSRNLAGIAHPAVDHLVEQIVTAQDKATLLHTTRALDRVLRSQHIVIPHWHVRHFRILYWNRFGIPEKRPHYSIGLDSWWVRE